MSEMAKEEYLKLRDGVIPQLEETIANAEKNDVFNLLLRHKAAKEAAEKQQLIMKSSTLEGEKKEEEEEGERASAYSYQSSSTSMTTEDPVVAELEHQIGGKASEVLDLVLLLMSSISRSHEELKEIDGHLGLIAYEGIPHANDDNIRHILGVFKTMGHQPAPAPYTLPHQLRQSHQSTDSSSSSSSSSSFNASSLSMTEKKPS